MSKLTVQEPFYFGGSIREVGSAIEVDNAADRKSLIDRGLIVEVKAEKGAEQNKMQPAPANKSRPKG